MDKFIILLLAASAAWLPAAADTLPPQTQQAAGKNGGQAIPQSLREILNNPEGWEMDVYSFPYEIDTFIPVSAENLYAKGEKVKLCAHFGQSTGRGGFPHFEQYGV